MKAPAQHIVILTPDLLRGKDLLFVHEKQQQVLRYAQDDREAA